MILSASDRSGLLCDVSRLVAMLADSGIALIPSHEHGPEIRDLAEQAAELAAPVLDYGSMALSQGWIDQGPGCLWIILDGRDSGFTAETAQEACEIDGFGPNEIPVAAHYAVTPALADKLEAAGERIDRDFAGLIVWAATADPFEAAARAAGWRCTEDEPALKGLLAFPWRHATRPHDFEFQATARDVCAAFNL